jgi:hypothetical protein
LAGSNGAAAGSGSGQGALALGRPAAGSWRRMQPERGMATAARALFLSVESMLRRRNQGKWRGAGPVGVGQGEGMGANAQELSVYFSNLR